MDTITSFSQITIPAKCLVVLDIDETVIRYENISSDWWTNKLNENLLIYNDHKTADFYALDEWITHINYNLPTHTDSDGLNDMFEKIKQYDGQVIYLTARRKYLEDITKYHLNYLNIKNEKIYFTGGENKGEILKSIVQDEYDHHNNIIFIDDRDENLHNVIKAMKHTEKLTKCYKFVM